MKIFRQILPILLLDKALFLLTAVAVTGQDTSVLELIYHIPVGRDDAGGSANSGNGSLKESVKVNATHGAGSFPDPILGVQSVCETDHCYELAQQTALSMNASADPCLDFYDYACGNWTRSNPIPDDRTNWSNFAAIDQKVTAQLREVLEREDKNDLSTARQKARKLYKACLDIERMETLGAEPLLAFLKSTVGPFPLFDNQDNSWNATAFDWFATVKRTSKFGSGFFLAFSAGRDSDDPKKNILHFSASNLALGTRKTYFDKSSESVRKAYKEYMRNLTLLFLGNGSVITPAIQEQLDEIYDFDTFLAQVSRSEEDSRNISLSINKMTLEKFHGTSLNTTISLEDLIDYIKIRMPNKTFTDLVTKDLVVNVANPDYFLRVHEKLAEYSRQPSKRRIIANYFGWRMAVGYSYKITQRFRDAADEYTKEISGLQKIQERWKACAGFVNYEMNTAVGSLYIKSFFDEASKPKIAGLVKDLRASFSTILKNADWLTSEPGSIWNNTLAFVKFDSNNNIEKLLKENNRSMDDSLAPADVNAYYSPPNNMIALVAGIFQLPFYDASRPDYLNYASIGAIIGHEITHGFDDRGSQFDGEGLYTNWWSAESRARYTVKSAEMMAKYGNYILPEGRVNGFLTLGENIADNGGVKEAFSAYQLYSKRKGMVEPLLPGFESYTQEQMFFIGYAQVWCGADREKSLRLSLPTQSHSPRRFRVIGPLSGMPQFAEAYQCPAESPMNPSKKVAVW
ncbi:Neprilysin-11 [Hypsibius exemplaris]|uniref:Neprilysin-11 n=1 Tax=Hypsibius exemplaris TaxID=2072580 RepID=A0A1W0WW99_HYPEX|nr:Neprilysin-11 [Hypsibius exemplaris]